MCIDNVLESNAKNGDLLLSFIILGMPLFQKKNIITNYVWISYSLYLHALVFGYFVLMNKSNKNSDLTFNFSPLFLEHVNGGKCSLRNCYDCVRS